MDGDGELFEFKIGYNADMCHSPLRLQTPYDLIHALSPLVWIVSQAKIGELA